jgi:hypothetical protein
VNEDRPVVTFVVDAQGSEPAAVESTLASLRAQSRSTWEVVLVGSPSPVAGDGVRCIEADGPPADRLATGLSQSAGELVAILDPGGIVLPQTVATLEGLAVDDDIDVVHTDEALVGESGAVHDWVRKPVWSPERLRGHNYLGRMTFLRSALARSLAAPEGTASAAAYEYDLLLRVTERATDVVRVPEVLYLAPSLRPVDEESWDESVAAVNRHLVRQGLPATAHRGARPGTSQLSWELPEELKIGVVITTSGERGLAWGEMRRFVTGAIRSLLSYAGHPRTEIVVVHPVDLNPTVLTELARLGAPDLRLVPVPQGTGRTEMCNLGVLATTSDVVVLLDERTEVAAPGFLPALVGPLLAGAGLSGPAVLAANQTLVDAGLARYRRRSEPMFAGIPTAATGSDDLLTITRECSALGASCLALQRDTFEDLGGLNERLDWWSGIDLAEKVAMAGLLRVWAPDAQLYRVAAPREPELLARRAERLLMRERWEAPATDPYVPTYGRWLAAQAAAAVGAD